MHCCFYCPFLLRSAILCKNVVCMNKSGKSAHDESHILQKYKVCMFIAWSILLLTWNILFNSCRFESSETECAHFLFSFSTFGFMQNLASAKRGKVKKFRQFRYRCAFGIGAVCILQFCALFEIAIALPWNLICGLKISNRKPKAVSGIAGNPEIAGNEPKIYCNPAWTIRSWTQTLTATPIVCSSPEIPSSDSHLPIFSTTSSGIWHLKLQAL